ncbi:MAG: hypothetical protein H6606_03890 [Flavobacteriales bacterium]|nr:hypothetical protein [Flavobacteriales bacterium]
MVLRTIDVSKVKPQSASFLSRVGLYFSLLLSIGFLNACSDNEAVLKESSGTTVYHVKNGNEVVSRMITTRDGGIMMVGSYGNDAFLFHMGSDGEEKWHVTISESGLDAFNDVCETSDGGFVVCGYTNSYSLGVNNVFQDGLVMKFDRDGREVWRRTYGLDRDDWLTSIVEVENGNLFLGGINRTDNMDTWILKLDQNGRLIWSKRYEIGPYFDLCMDVEVKPDGNYAILGYASPSGVAFEIRKYRIYFASIQKDSGTINQGWIYAEERTEPIDPFRNFLTFHKTSDGFCWMDNSSTTTNKRVVLMVQTNFSGDVLNSSYIQSEKFNKMVDFKVSNDGFALFGSEYPDQVQLTSSKGLMMELDKSGTVVSRIYSGNENGQRVLFGGIQANGHWRLGGSTWNDQIGRSKLFLEKLDVKSAQ